MILVSRLLNLLALGFTIAFSAFLLLFVRWRALRSECILADTCDISEVALASSVSRDRVIAILTPFSSPRLCMLLAWVSCEQPRARAHH